MQQTMTRVLNLAVSIFSLLMAALGTAIILTLAIIVATGGNPETWASNFSQLDALDYIIVTAAVAWLSACTATTILIIKDS